LKKNYFSSHKLPKQQSTNFWSQGILGVKRFGRDVSRVGRVTADSVGSGKWLARKRGVVAGRVARSGGGGQLLTNSTLNTNKFIFQCFVIYYN
jgi:hypothetical protein